jgi:hypothetical protein
MEQNVTLTSNNLSKVLNVLMILLAISEFSIMILLLKSFSKSNLQEMYTYSMALAGILAMKVCLLFYFMKCKQFTIFHFCFPISGWFYPICSFFVYALCFWFLGNLINEIKNQLPSANSKEIDYNYIKKHKNALAIVIFGSCALEILSWMFIAIKSIVDKKDKTQTIQKLNQN